MKLQKNTSLALYSVLEFAREPERHIAAAEIADKYDISAHHLAKVLAELARSGILASVRGAGGGYRFIGNAKRLTLMDIVQMFEDYGNGYRRNEDDADEDTAIYAVLLDRVSADKTTMAKYLATDRAHGDNDISALADLLA